MEEEKKTIKTKEKKKVSRKVIVLVVIALTILMGYIYFRGEYLESLEIGEQYTSIFWQNLRYSGITLACIFVLTFIIMLYTNSRIKAGLKEFFEQEKKEMPKLPNKSISLIISILVSAISTNAILNKLILFTNSAQFVSTDPIFGIDIGYFIFQKPFLEFICFYILIFIIGLTIYTAIYYIVCFNQYFDGIDRETLKNSHLVKQLLRNVIWIAVILAALILLNTQSLGTQKFLTIETGDTSYSLYGAGFTDVTVKLWGYRILALVVVVSVWLAVRFYKKNQVKRLLISIMAVPSYLVLLMIVTFGFNMIFIGKNELDKEKEYITYNISNTRDAYGINIEEVSISDNKTIDEATVAENREVIENIPIADEDIVLQSLNTSQTGKGYYQYTNTQIGLYQIDGKQQLIYVSPREIYSGKVTYNYKTYEYTHGYGVILTSASTVQENGSVNNIQKSFTESEKINITEPRIYFGTSTDDTVVTNTKDKVEFDYPILDSNTAENTTNTYNGEAGLSLNFIDRLILAIKERDLKLAFSTNVSKDSKILTNRNIIQRAKTIMPDLLYDENPYLVINDEGRLIWVLDAYTVSNDYPYSQRITIEQDGVKREINYIRNSIKVLIDAYDGTTQFYITDRSDPIATAYRNIYPDVFMPKDEEIPDDIKEHLVYPKLLHQVQAEIIARYHNVQPEVLYRGDDIWSISTKTVGRTSTKTGTEFEPYYTMVRTIDSAEAKLGLVIPYSQFERQNIISYMVGTYSENGEPSLKVYKFPTDSNVLGPMQLDTQLEQNTSIAKEIEALNVNGTSITKNMSIIPIQDSLLYVVPIYQQYINESDSLPTLKKVVVASGNKVAIGDTLSSALSNLLSKSAADIEIQNTDNMDDLILAIVKANQNLEESVGNSDWEMIGKDLKSLQALIDRLEILAEENGIKNSSTDTTETSGNERSGIESFIDSILNRNQNQEGQEDGSINNTIE